MTPTDNSTLSLPCTIDSLRSGMKLRHRLTAPEIRDLMLACFMAAMYAVGDLAMILSAFLLDNILVAIAIGFTLRHTLHLDRETFAEAKRLIVRAWRRTRWMPYDDFMREFSNELEAADVIRD